MAPTMARPHVARVLEQTRAALFVFGDMACDLFQGVDGPAVAREIHDRLFARGHRMSLLVAINQDPITMMWYARQADPDSGAEATKLVRKVEIAAARTAVLLPGMREALHACRGSGRSIAVVGDASSEAMETYLEIHGLRDLVGAVIGRERLFPLPVSLQTGETLLQQAMQALDAEPTGSALVTLTPHGMYTAMDAGIYSIGVVNTRGPRKHLTGFPGAVAVSSMAQLAAGFATVPLLRA